MGMTNEQYKGLLLHWLEDLKDLLEAAKKTNDAEMTAAVERKIALTNQMLEF